MALLHVGVVALADDLDAPEMTSEPLPPAEEDGETIADSPDAAADLDEESVPLGDNAAQTDVGAGKGNTTTWIVVGSTVGGTIVVAAIVVAIVLVRKKKGQNRHR